MFNQYEKIHPLPTDVVTEHSDAQGNKTLFLARRLPDGRQMCAVTRPDGTVIFPWKELQQLRIQQKGLNP